jgi:superfamily I DNA/RNA helicase
MIIASKYQKDIYDVFQNTNSNINISAVAGSGKTTVLLELLKFIPRDKTALFVAFNNSIVDELKNRIGVVDNIEISTIHSFGWHSILRRYGNRVKMNPNKVFGKIESVLKEYDNISTKKHGYYFYIIPRIIDLMRCNMVNADKDELLDMTMNYDLDVEPLNIEIAIKVFNKFNKDKTQFDFTDMIYQPAVDNSIRLRKYDYVFCDESQDFSAAQQEVIRRSLNRRGRLITVGDSHQAIYGFAGADSESYNNLSTLNGESVTMPLSVCYRCSKSIVIEAQSIVPEIRYDESAPMGVVRNGTLVNDLRQGDWILCRNLKPLVQTYLWLMKNKVKSRIKGKDIGEGILGMINKTGAKSLRAMWTLLKLDQERLVSKLKKRGIRRPLTHPKMELYTQRLEVIEYLMTEVHDVAELKTLIGNIFSDNIDGIILSTIHKSKGLENDRILFLCPELIPSRFATTEWMLEQERNLRYVAVTRAKQELIYITSSDFLDDLKHKIIL